MGWTAEEQALFIGLNLGPALSKKGFGGIQIMILDDQRFQIPKWTKIVRINKNKEIFQILLR